MRSNMTRRDFINATLAGSGATLLQMNAPLSRGAAFARALPPERPLGADWYGYGGVGDYASSHGNTPQALAEAHGIRHGHYDSTDAGWHDTGETYDLVVVGAGLAGLGAALEFSVSMPDGARCLMFDNHPVFGGEAKQNQFEVDGHLLTAPQGSNGFSIPPPVGARESKYAVGDAYYYDLLGLPRTFSYPEIPPGVGHIGFGGDNYGFMYWLQREIDVSHFYKQADGSGVHARDVWRNGFRDAPIPEAARAALIAADTSRERPFEGEDPYRWADSMSCKDFLEGAMGLDPAVTAYLDPIVASIVGSCCAATSAYVLLAVGLPGARGYNDDRVDNRHSFPGGNTGFVRHFVKRIMPHAIGGDDGFADIINGGIRFDRLDQADQRVRMRLAATVVGVEHDAPDPQHSDWVRIRYVRDGRRYQLKARGVVMASGGWVNRHVVRDLPAGHARAYASFNHAAFLVVNVALTNWRFLEKLGVSGSIYEGELGFSCNLRRPMLVGARNPPFAPDKPAVLTFYVPFYFPGQTPAAQGTMGRLELFGTSYAAYEQKIIRQLDELYASAGFDAERDVAGIILNRWGHAFVMPEPGFFFGQGGRPAPAAIVSEPHGRIAFGHSELHGLQHWGPAASEGRRAFLQLRERIA